jgi:hypothetical protein
MSPVTASYKKIFLDIKLQPKVIRVLMDFVPYEEKDDEYDDDEDHLLNHLLHSWSSSYYSSSSFLDKLH